jgi:hypothetical protein
VGNSPCRGGLLFQNNFEESIKCLKGEKDDTLALVNKKTRIDGDDGEPALEGNARQKIKQVKIARS